MQPIQQHGRRMPSLSSVRTRSTCCCLVSGFFTEMVQQIHSLRASGVRSSHIVSASASAARVSRKLSGSSWTTPPEISSLVIDNMALSRKDCRISRRSKLPTCSRAEIVARRDKAAVQHFYLRAQRAENCCIMGHAITDRERYSARRCTCSCRRLARQACMSRWIKKELCDEVDHPREGEG